MQLHKKSLTKPDKKNVLQWFLDNCSAVCTVAFEEWFRRKWVWNLKVAQTIAMFVQRYSMCTVCYVVHKVQSRFLVKQEACFYLCCTEQLLETPALSRLIWLREGKNTLGTVSLYMHKGGSKILQVQTLLWGEMIIYLASALQDEQHSVLVNWGFWCMKQCMTDFTHRPVAESRNSTTTTI